MLDSMAVELGEAAKKAARARLEFTVKVLVPAFSAGLVKKDQLAGWDFHHGLAVSPDGDHYDQNLVNHGRLTGEQAAWLEAPKF